MYTMGMCITMFILLALAGGEKQTVESRITGKEVVSNEQQIRNLSSKKIFFGHQSVGDNIVQGIRDDGIGSPIEDESDLLGGS